MKVNREVKQWLPSYVTGDSVYGPLIPMNVVWLRVKPSKDEIHGCE